MQSSAQQNPLQAIQTIYCLSAALVALRAYKLVGKTTKKAFRNWVETAEKTCAAIPWLPREQAALKDGSITWIGPIADGRELVGFYNALPEKTLRERFHSRYLPSFADDLGKKLDARQMSVLGAYDANNRLAGIVEIVPLRDPSQAEISFMIRPDFQGKGLGGWLVNACFRRCAEMGISTVIAEVETGESSSRIARYFPRETCVQNGRDISCYLRLDQHPALRLELLSASSVQYQRRLANMFPSPSPQAKESTLFPSRILAILAHA